MRAVELPSRCANLECPNRPEEGRFVLVESGGLDVGGHRRLRLWMCAPCADALLPGIVELAVVPAEEEREGSR